MDPESSDRGSNPRETLCMLATRHHNVRTCARTMCVQTKKKRRHVARAERQRHGLRRRAAIYGHRLCRNIWSRGVTVSTLDPESSDRGSNPRETSCRRIQSVAVRRCVCVCLHKKDFLGGKHRRVVQAKRRWRRRRVGNCETRVAFRFGAA